MSESYVHTVALMAFIIVVLTLAIAGGLPAFVGWSTNQYPLWRFPDLLLPVVAPAFAAGAFAKEYEQRTWQDLLLTRLNAREILSGKFFACFLPTIATIIVLFPPFALILIIENMRWAQEPGPWMAVVGIKFLLSATFYLAVALVCSYHNSNTRVSLVVGYIILALYGLANFFLWRTITPFFLFDMRASTPFSPYSAYSPREANSLLTLSRTEFGLSFIDTIHLIQSALLSFFLLWYLLVRIRHRRSLRG